MLFLSRFVPVPFLTRYRLGGADGPRMRCAWIQFRGRALLAHHWLRSA